MDKLLLIVLVVALCGCGTARTVQTFTADTAATASELTTAVSYGKARDSSVAVATAVTFDSELLTETVTTETFDTAGNLRQRTTTERHLSRNRHTERRDSTAATSTTTTADSLAMASTASHKSLITSTTENEKNAQKTHRRKPLRLRYWLLIMLALTAVVAFFRYKQQQR